MWAARCTHPNATRTGGHSAAGRRQPAVDQPLQLVRARPAAPLSPRPGPGSRRSRVSRACSFSPDASSGGRPSSVRALRTAPSSTRGPPPPRGRPGPRRRRSISRTLPDLLLQLLLGVPVGLVDRPGGLAQVVELAQLVRHPGERLGHRLADRVLAVGHDPGDRHPAGVPHRGQQLGQVLLPGRQQALGQQDLADRQSRMTHSTSCPTSGWSPSMARITFPCAASTLLQPAVVGQGDGEQFVVPVEQVGDGPLGHGHPAADEVGADLGDGPVLGVPEAADEGDDVEPELVPRAGRRGPRPRAGTGACRPRTPGWWHRRMVRLRRVTPARVWTVRRLA